MENLALDSSKISTYLECNRKYQLSYQEHLVTLESQPALDKGTIGHKFLEYYYNCRKDGASVGDSTQMAIVSTTDWLKTQEQFNYLPPEEIRFLFNRLTIYTAYYSGDNFKILGTEVGFSKELFKTQDYIYIVEGKIDVVIEDSDGKIAYKDHKFQSRKYDYYQNNVQFMTYALACETNAGVINYIGLQKEAPKDGFFRRVPIHFSRSLLNEWRLELLQIFDSIARDRKFSKNRSACKRGLNRKCQFTHICEQTDKRFEAEVKRTEFKVRDAWTPWELEEFENG
jgi:hypothetical protein